MSREARWLWKRVVREVDGGVHLEKGELLMTVERSGKRRCPSDGIGVSMPTQGAFRTVRGAIYLLECPSAREESRTRA